MHDLLKMKKLIITDLRKVNENTQQNIKVFAVLLLATYNLN